MRKNFPRVWEIVHCTLCAYCVHIIVQFTLYTLVYSSHCTLHTAHCTMPLVGRQLEVCTLHCTLYIVLMPCTLHSSHCTCRFTCWYTVPVHLCTSAPVHCTCACTPGTCTSLWYLQHIVLQVSAQHVYSIGDCST